MPFQLGRDRSGSFGRVIYVDAHNLYVRKKLIFNALKCQVVFRSVIGR